MKRIAIINFTGFRGNWGCQATSFELLKFIAGCFSPDEALEFSCVPLLPSSRVDQYYDGEIDKVFDAFTQVHIQSHKSASALAYLEAACVQRYGFWADIVRSADLVVFQAEGSMGLGQNFARGPRLMLLPFVAKHAWKRTVVSLNQSFYSQDSRIIQNAVEAFSSFDFAAFREGASVAFARKNGLKNAFYVPDLAFMTPPSTPPEKPWLDPAKRYFAISGSALKDPSRYDHILNVSRKIAAMTEMEPVLALSRDVQLSIKSLFSFGGPKFNRVPRNATYSRVAALLGRCAFLLGGRYHMSIISATAATPSIILAGNSFKNEGLASLMRSERPVRMFSDYDLILSDVEHIINQGELTRNRLSEQVDHIRSVIKRAQNAVTNVVHGLKVSEFEDQLPEYELKSDLLERYHDFGRGPKKQSFVLPGDRLGRRNNARDLLRPLLDANQNDEPTRQTLRRIALGDQSILRVV